MVRVLGLRAEARQFSWAVVEGTQREPVPVEHDTAAAPVDLDEARGLTWLRQRVRLVIERHKPTKVVLRTPEMIAQPGNLDSARRRLRLEGVLLEASHADGLQVTTGALVTIARMLGAKSAKDAKLYLEQDDFRGVNMSKFAKPLREAVLVAIAGLPNV